MWLKLRNWRRCWKKTSNSNSREICSKMVKVSKFFRGLKSWWRIHLWIIVLSNRKWIKLTMTWPILISLQRCMDRVQRRAQLQVGSLWRMEPSLLKINRRLKHLWGPLLVKVQWMPWSPSVITQVSKQVSQLTTARSIDLFWWTLTIYHSETTLRSSAKATPK